MINSFAWGILKPRGEMLYEDIFRIQFSTLLVMIIDELIVLYQKFRVSWIDMLNHYDFCLLKNIISVVFFSKNYWLHLEGYCLWHWSDSTVLNGILNFDREPKPEVKIEVKSCDVKPDMPPPPSPDSSTCSDHSGPTLISTSLSE